MQKKKKMQQKKKTKPTSRLRSYRVVWEIDVEARSPKEAAIEARRCQEPGTTATVFNVYDERGKCKCIDLTTSTLLWIKNLRIRGL